MISVCYKFVVDVSIMKVNGNVFVMVIVCRVFSLLVNSNIVVMVFFKYV